MADVFETIVGQPEVRTFLRAAVDGKRVSHAYLFIGPAGSGKTLAAYALAQVFLCPDGGCGSCETCRRILRRKHPDVRYYAPEGANGYLIEQVREIVSDTMLAPIQASSKVYILDRVDLLGVSAANAFLKTLEEPPADVLLILLGRTRESVLPTVLSRCQVLPFRHIPTGEAAGILSQHTGATLQAARVALQACDGSLDRATDFLKSSERMAFRARVFEVMSSLRLADDWDVITYAQDLVLQAKVPLDTVRAQQEVELAESADFLAKSALRQVEARNKRALSAKSFELLRQTIALIRSWLRDVMLIAAGVAEEMVNTDLRDALECAAAYTDEVRAAAALVCCKRAEEALSYNVSSETCLDALLFEIRSVLYDQGGLRKAAV